jgi:hypothetical protein
MIGTRSADILKMDIFQKHNTVAGIYEKKFLPFGELLPSEELNSVKLYLDDTKIGEAPAHPGPREMADTPWGTGIRGVRGWTVTNSWFLKKWTGDQTEKIWVREGSYSEVSDFWKDHWSPALAAYDGALAEYNRLKTQYDTSIKNASSLEFPSVTFDNLVSKVNGFFKKLI